MRELDKSFDRFGRTTYVTCDNWTTRDYKAIIEPLRYKNKMYLNGFHNELGHYPEGFYLFIGPVKMPFDEFNDTALIHTPDGKSYEIHRWEKVYLRDDPLYIWAAIKEKVN